MYYLPPTSLPLQREKNKKGKYKKKYLGANI